MTVASMFGTDDPAAAPERCPVCGSVDGLDLTDCLTEAGDDCGEVVCFDCGWTRDEGDES